MVGVRRQVGVLSGEGVSDLCHVGSVNPLCVQHDVAFRQVGDGCCIDCLRRAGEEGNTLAVGPCVPPYEPVLGILLGLGERAGGRGEVYAEGGGAVVHGSASAVAVVHDGVCLGIPECIKDAGASDNRVLEVEGYPLSTVLGPAVEGVSYSFKNCRNLCKFSAEDLLDDIVQFAAGIEGDGVVVNLYLRLALGHGGVGDGLVAYVDGVSHFLDGHVGGTRDLVHSGGDTGHRILHRIVGSLHIVVFCCIQQVVDLDGHLDVEGLPDCVEVDCGTVLCGEVAYKFAVIVCLVAVSTCCPAGHRESDVAECIGGERNGVSTIGELLGRHSAGCRLGVLVEDHGVGVGRPLCVQGHDRTVLGSEVRHIRGGLVGGSASVDCGVPSCEVAAGLGESVGRDGELDIVGGGDVGHASTGCTVSVEGDGVGVGCPLGVECLVTGLG